mgnify:CR=1 FL=1
MSALHPYERENLAKQVNKVLQTFDIGKNLFSDASGLEMWEINDIIENRRTADLTVETAKACATALGLSYWQLIEPKAYPIKPEHRKCIRSSPTAKFAGKHGLNFEGRKQYS